jgi:hypothetical protein
MTKQVIPVLFIILLFSSMSFSTSPTEVKARLPTNLDDQNGRANIPMAIPVDSNANTESLGIESSLGTVNDPEKSLVSPDSESPSSLATCNKLSVTSVSASGNDGNVPTNVLDNNLNTRWSDNGVGSWIQLDLGSKKSICSVDIAWYRGNVRENNFAISVSDNGNTFTNKFTGTSSGSTTSPEKYTLPAGTEGRYVRITVNGNTENNWASITEIAVFGSDGTSSSCTKQPPTAISASDFWGSNSPSKAIDNNFNTRWANKGVGSWIQLDLGSTKNICSVDIAWYLGQARQFKFDISVSVSNDGTSFAKVRSGTSSGTTTAFEKYTLPAGTEARYVRITVNGNDVTTYGNAAEIAVFGSDGTSSSCTKQPPTAISASNFISPNSPSKAIDNNFDTRWSNKGEGSWLQLDLGSTKNICSVDVAWYFGNVRQFKFDISVSVSNDGTSFTKVRSGTSSGTTTAFEKYTLPAGTESRYVRITVNGNDVTDYAAIAEIAIFGSAGGSTPPPDDGGDAGTNDKFGIKKIYSSKPNGEQWFMNMQDPSNDPRTSEPSMSRNSDGSWRVTSGQVRYGVFTSSGYLPDQVEKDHSVVASRGYMQSPNDWKNVEMTGQVKYNSGGDDEWTWYARGGRHTGSGWEDGCEGVALKGSLAYTGGDVRWAKEQWHVSYVFQPWRNSPADGDGKFVGFKVAIYNMQLNGKTVVKMESWVDPNNNNQWQKVYDFIDQGGWGSEGGECRGASDQIVTWGGPIASFRWDDGNSIDIKNLSVREIVPPSQ